MKTLKNKKAFTLTELVVVIAIIGILAAVLIPSITSYIGNAKESAAIQDATSMYQEVLAELDVTEPEYEEVTGVKFWIVKVDNYNVILKNGSNINEVSKTEYTLGDLVKDGGIAEGETQINVLTMDANEKYLVNTYKYDLTTTKWDDGSQIWPVLPEENV